MQNSKSLKAVSVTVLSATENAAETPMSDTIKTGTLLIEEGALMPESLGPRSGTKIVSRFPKTKFQIHLKRDRGTQ
jgi:hypothetical protein